MALETFEWKITDSLQDPEGIFFYLEAVLDENDKGYDFVALQNVLSVRGGAQSLAAETGVPVARLQGSNVDRETLAAVMEAFRPASEAAGVKVA